jgi:hypothetical protein
MFNKTRVTFILAMLVGSSTTVPADVRHPTRHPHRIHAKAPAHTVEPARMIEVRPGLWMGSYQCVTDLERGGRDCSSRP